MMGYAMVNQRTHGIHFRLRSRAFAFDDGVKRVVFVNVDACMVMQGVKLTVITRLADIFGPDVYTNENVLLSGIHTHSGPGGFSWYTLYEVTTLGYVACHQQ
jgi:neutral ceramidase